MSPHEAVADTVIELPSDQDHTGRTLGKEEIALVTGVIESGTLTSTKGTAVNSLERRFEKLLDIPHAVACASGTAAIHTAVAALNPEPGDEIISSPITDMGAIAPIIYQGAIPVFADVDPRTCNITAQTIEDRLSDRTRGIIVTHLFGNPADMPAIMKLADRHNIPVIEDCAQAYLAKSNGRMVGAIGAIGCFSLQQGKHITTGEGGVVVSARPDLARHMRLFVNKAWGYGDPNPDHYFLAPNYRLTELQGAVALAQMDKLECGVQQRIDMARRLTDQISDLPGIAPPWQADNTVHSFWRYCVWVDETEVPGGSPALGAALKTKGIATAPRYIQKPAFQCAVLRDQRTFGNSRFPFMLARPEAVDYDPENFPGTFKGLHDILVLPWNELYNETHIDYIAAAIRSAHQSLRNGGHHA